MTTTKKQKRELENYGRSNFDFMALYVEDISRVYKGLLNYVNLNQKVIDFARPCLRVSSCIAS